MSNYLLVAAKIDFNLIVSFLTTVYNKRTHQALTGYNKNNNFDNRRISRTCVLGAQKNRLIETLLLNV